MSDNKNQTFENKTVKTYRVPAIYDKLNDQFHNKANSSLTVEVPGSKSITNRALLLATLAKGESTLRGVLFSDDSRHFLKCIQELGFDTTVDEEAKVITVAGQGGSIPKKEASLYVGSAGTAARFLTALLGVTHGTYHMDASAQMRKRPMAPLLDSLTELGCNITYPLIPDENISAENISAENFSTDNPAAKSNVGYFPGYFPFILSGSGFHKKEITIDIDKSSQFLSALLITACLAEDDFTIHIKGTHGMSYIEMTCLMMRQFGVEAVQTSDDTFIISKGQAYQVLDYRIEPDVSAACYFYAMVPLLHIPVLVRHVHFDSLQGDVAFLHILEQMGCSASDTEDGILLTPPETDDFHGVTANMSACSDQAITLAATAVFADSPTTITGIGHIRFQESDRIHAIVTELGKMGIRCEETADSITIYPGVPKPSYVDTYDDHRMAMGFSLIGLRSEGIVINDPDCCRKTFENYFEVLDAVIKELTA